MIKKSVLRKFEGSCAILFIVDISQYITVPQHLLPKDANVGTWLLLEFDESKLIKAVIDVASTEKTKAKLPERVSKLLNFDQWWMNCPSWLDEDD